MPSPVLTAAVRFSAAGRPYTVSVNADGSYFEVTNGRGPDAVAFGYADSAGVYRLFACEPEGPEPIDSAPGLADAVERFRTWASTR
jgi:hypothetical protein